MSTNDPITITRDVDAAVIPIGTKVTLQKGEQAHITQSLGGSYTVIVMGNYDPPNAESLADEIVDFLAVQKVLSTP